MIIFAPCTYAAGYFVAENAEYRFTVCNRNNGDGFALNYASKSIDGPTGYRTGSPSAEAAFALANELFPTPTPTLTFYTDYILGGATAQGGLPSGTYAAINVTSDDGTATVNIVLTSASGQVKIGTWLFTRTTLDSALAIARAYLPLFDACHIRSHG